MPGGGDFRKLDLLIQRIADLKNPSSKLRRDLSTVMGEQAVSLIQQGFADSKDPYGNAWAPLRNPSKRRGGRSAKPLRHTGRLLNSYKWRVTANGFRVSSNVEYASVHQFGAFIQPHSRLNRALVFDKRGRFVSTRTKASRARIRSYWMGSATYRNGIRIPRRQMVPMQETGGVGPIWTKALSAQAECVLRIYFKEP